MTSSFLTRRTFLAGTTAAALTSGCGDPNEVQPPRIKVPAGPRFDVTPFQLGVASGDCVADSVILWTRLAPSPLDGGGAWRIHAGTGVLERRPRG